MDINNFLQWLLIAYFLIINLISIIITIVDKRKAEKHKWRIKESTLLIYSLLGGSVSMFITMRIIHHKTKTKKFMIGIPAIFVGQLAVTFLVLKFIVFAV